MHLMFLPEHSVQSIEILYYIHIWITICQLITAGVVEVSRTTVLVYAITEYFMHDLGAYRERKQISLCGSVRQSGSSLERTEQAN